ncbi:hypothetical protein [Arcobacter sp. LA11]|uniref:hypothetical protein n=1 Tax=Arcobacter sp. LA11 TaxID=1898176 RepID=UPI0009336674|nr:hypothetical protein [Arcobacter sp. LA11]
MEISSDIKTYSDVSSVEKNSTTQKSDDFSQLLETKDMTESEYKKLTFEEAKELQLQREKEGAFKTKETEGYDLMFGEFGTSLLQVTTLTNDEAFNKAAFETMKKKEIPAMYLTELKNNMDYHAGRRKNPHGSLDVSEVYGNSSSLSRNEMNQIDLDAFLENIINTYVQLLSNLPSYLNRDDTKQSLDDLKEIQENYQENKNDNKTVVEQIVGSNNINPFHVQSMV